MSAESQGSVIECVGCHTKNRVPSSGEDQELRCGHCHEVLTHASDRRTTWHRSAEGAKALFRKIAVAPCGRCKQDRNIWLTSFGSDLCPSCEAESEERDFVRPGPLSPGGEGGSEPNAGRFVAGPDGGIVDRAWQNSGSGGDVFCGQLGRKAPLNRQVRWRSPGGIAVACFLGLAAVSTGWFLLSPTLWKDWPMFGAFLVLCLASAAWKAKGAVAYRCSSCNKWMGKRPYAH